MQLSRALSDLVKYTKSVGSHDVDMEGEGRPGLQGVGEGLAAPAAPLTPAACAHSGVQLAGVLLQRDQGPADPAAEAGAVPALQPAPAVAHLPVLLPRGLQQLQPAALLERRLPAGWVRQRRGRTARAPQRQAGSLLWFWGPAWCPANFTRLALGWDPQSPGLGELSAGTHGPACVQL